MLAQLRDKGPIAVVDGGFTLNKSGPMSDGPGVLEQRQIKAALIASALAEGGIDAMALGADDWRLGTQFVRDLVSEHNLPVLAANLTCDGGAPFAASQVVTIGDRRLGIVGVTDGAVDGCEVAPMRPALVAAAEKLPEVDLVLGLIPVRHDRDLGPFTTGEELPIDVVVDARGTPAGAGGQARDGAWFVGAGTRAKSLGVMRLHFADPDAPWSMAGLADKIALQVERMTARRASTEGQLAQQTDPAMQKRLSERIEAYTTQIESLREQMASASGAQGNQIRLEQVDLDDSFADHGPTQARVDAAKSKITMAGSSDPRKFVPRIVAQGPYAGGEACAGCHPAEHSQWSRTGHARAWAALVAEDRALDHECWSCHVTGAGAPGGPVGPEASGGYRDVQCEACHGPARDHLADPETIKPVADPSIEVCTACHDGEQDGGRFDAATYRSRVVHAAAAEP